VQKIVSADLCRSLNILGKVKLDYLYCHTYLPPKNIAIYMHSNSFKGFLNDFKALDLHPNSPDQGLKKPAGCHQWSLLNATVEYATNHAIRFCGMSKF
jgi:hypothetical protein